MMIQLLFQMCYLILYIKVLYDYVQMLSFLIHYMTVHLYIYKINRTISSSFLSNENYVLFKTGANRIEYTSE